MQFIKHVLPKTRSTTRSIFTATNPLLKEPKMPRYSVQNQQILDDTMIPGPYLRFFKTKRERRQPHDTNGNTISPNAGAIEQLYTSPARPIHYNEFDSAPNITQERLAERLQRAVSTMYSTETMPTQWVTPSQLTINGIKVSRNLRKCRIMYEPISNDKKERGNVHRNLQEYTNLLSSMIRSHALVKRPLSIKFVPDTQTKELDDIFNRITAEMEATADEEK